jgi:predicted glycogen debranching enzyme
MAEWLEADGTGGFVSGTADGIRTRRYHALLLTQSAAGRYVLVNGIEAWVDLPQGATFITSQRYAPDVIHPDGATRIADFTHEPWPCWTFALPDGSTIVQELFVAGGQTSLRWTRTGAGPATLHVRLLMSGRDYHALHHENPAFDFTPEKGPGFVRFRPYPDVPPTTAFGGTWHPAPDWFRGFLYTQERERGLDAIEDLASPGILTWDLATPATLALRADTAPAWPVAILAQAEAAERAAHPPLHRAALQYVTRTNDRSTIVAGYPWFTDWGRDTFISIRGLLLQKPSPPAIGLVREKLANEARLQSNKDLAEKILLAWCAHVDDGMLPNRFPDGAGTPEYNAVDASLWFVIAVHDLLTLGTSPATRIQLQDACTAILDGYAAGTRYGIGMDTDGLVRAGAPGVQLTWMDAKVGDWVVTPRIGKPVEIQALWINALRIAVAWNPGSAQGQRWAAMAAQASAAFLARFPDRDSGGLLDVVDGDPVESRRIRPNQIFACGGLPHRIVEPAMARRIVDLVEARLLTPLGLRTLDPADPAYHPRFEGGPLQRDSAYHQGTAWPWLLAPFVDAWLHVQSDIEAAMAVARDRFLPPLLAHLAEAGLGHVSEVVDGDAPHHPGGCPFQAWSLGALLQIEALLQP